MSEKGKEPALYFEIGDKSLQMGMLKRKRGGRFFCKKHDEVKFESFEVKKGIIYNPSALYLHIKRFLNKNRISNKLSVISIPYLRSKDSIKSNLQILQVALCFCKAGLTIYKIIDTLAFKEGKK